MRLGRGFTAVARRVPRLAGLVWIPAGWPVQTATRQKVSWLAQGAVPLNPDCAPWARRGVGRHAAWPGFYRRGTTGATARGSGVAPCSLDRKDHHSATGLMARIKGHRGFEITLAFCVAEISNLMSKYPDWHDLSMVYANRRIKIKPVFCAAKPSKLHRSIPSIAI